MRFVRRMIGAKNGLSVPLRVFLQRLDILEYSTSDEILKSWSNLFPKVREWLRILKLEEGSLKERLLVTPHSSRMVLLVVGRNI